MQHQVDAVGVRATAFAVIDGQGAIANKTVKRRLLERKVEAVSGKQLPREVAAHAKSTYVTEKLKLLARSQFVPHPEPDERINPIYRAGSCDRARTRPLEAKATEIDCPGHCQREVDLLAPIAGAAEQI